MSARLRSCCESRGICLSGGLRRQPRKPPSDEGFQGASHAPGRGHGFGHELTSNRVCGSLRRPKSKTLKHAAVGCLLRHASLYGSEGWGFESLRARNHWSQDIDDSRTYGSWVRLFIVGWLPASPRSGRGLPVSATSVATTSPQTRSPACYGRTATGGQMSSVKPTSSAHGRSRGPDAVPLEAQSLQSASRVSIETDDLPTVVRP